MNFLAQLLQGIAYVPAIVQGVEGLFGNKAGANKKAAALAFIQNAVSAADLARQVEQGIVDHTKFQTARQSDRRRSRVLERFGLGRSALNPYSSPFGCAQGRLQQRGTEKIVDKSPRLCASIVITVL